MSQTRSVWAKAFRSLLTSLKPRQVRGNFMGKDYFGTKYFEIPADPQAGKRKPERWFLPLEKNKFDQEIPSEWEAWLRGRRVDIPTNDELQMNLAISDMKKTNSKKVALENPFVTDETGEMVQAPQFPVYTEYEDPDPDKKSDMRFKPL